MIDERKDRERKKKIKRFAHALGFLFFKESEDKKLHANFDA